MKDLKIQEFLDRNTARVCFYFMQTYGIRKEDVLSFVRELKTWELLLLIADMVKRNRIELFRVLIN